MQRWIACFGILTLALSTGACSDGTPAQQGTLGTGCYPDQTCADNLVCEDGICAETPPEPQGYLNGPCYPNGTCNDDLVCIEFICTEHPGLPEPGQLDGPCYGNNSCDAGLICEAGICRPGDIPDTIGTDVIADTGATADTSDCAPGSGCFLDPCEENGDCISGICLLHEGNWVCSEHCIDECPQGWSCRTINTGSSDALFACISTGSHLCLPCIDNNDCSSLDSQNLCLDYGQLGKFCGSACDEPDDCLVGYVCEEILTSEGGIASQCMNQDGNCACTDYAINMGLITDCAVTNDYGVCTGVRTCTDDGLSDCDAAEPLEEICDGLDNDCDGDVDTGLTPPLSDNQNGICGGSIKLCSGADGWTEPDYTALPDHEDTETLCDGLDNDCDGTMDNGLTPPPSDNQDGLCDGSIKVCAGADGWTEPDYAGIATYEGTETLCDGIDNDCDGDVDNGLTPPLSDNQNGLCAGSIKLCSGADGWTNPAYTALPEHEATETLCDGIDNDCDGVVDNGLTPPLSNDQDGICAGSIKVCAGADGWTEPDYTALPDHEGTETLCDGLDNDCDGTIDNGLTPPLSDNQNGLCTGSIKLCSGADGWTEPDYTALPGHEGTETLCDGLDNDCDGSVDNGLLPPLSDNQNGICAGSIKLCSGAEGWTEPDYTALPDHEATETLCDSVDNDCDGTIDNGLLPPLSDNQNGICAGSIKVCSWLEGWIEPDYTALADHEGTETLCDSLDNDCDGTIDNGLLPPLSDNQNGICAGSLKVCTWLEGWTEPDYTALPDHEDTETLCDGYDNDCDGTVDNDLIAPLSENQTGVCAGATKSCAGASGWVNDYSHPEYELDETQCDGLDNDCDGLIDHELTPPLSDNQNGVCAGEVKTCTELDGWVEPDYTTLPDYEGIETLCDGYDNDCDGSVDNGLSAPLSDNQTGICAGATKSCSGAAGWVNDYSHPEYEPEETQCDGLDNDCDGDTDDLCIPLGELVTNPGIDSVDGSICGSGDSSVDPSYLGNGWYGYVQDTHPGNGYGCGNMCSYSENGAGGEGSVGFTGGPNGAGCISWFYQCVTIPNSFSAIDLSFWLRSYSLQNGMHRVFILGDSCLTEGPLPGGQWAPWGANIIYENRDEPTSWSVYNVDLTEELEAYKGQTLFIGIGTNNSWGATYNGRTWVDNVHLIAE